MAPGAFSTVRNPSLPSVAGAGRLSPERPVNQTAQWFHPVTLMKMPRIG
jgi:hypothetical protein